jgi:hypothetical protein
MQAWAQAVGEAQLQMRSVVMAYFSNGIEGEVYESRVCAHCVHNDNCAVLKAHEIHNYEQIKDGEVLKDHPLQILIPDDAKGHPSLCRMFYSLDAIKMTRAKEAWRVHSEVLK